jgi:hypothetical protein
MCVSSCVTTSSIQSSKYASERVHRRPRVDDDPHAWVDRREPVRVVDVIGEDQVDAAARLVREQVGEQVQACSARRRRARCDRAPDA